jgi:hypothetical protein
VLVILNSAMQCVSMLWMGFLEPSALSEPCLIEQSAVVLVVLNSAMQCVSMTWMDYLEPSALNEPSLIENSVLFPFDPFFVLDKRRKRGSHYASHTIGVSSCYFKVRKRNVGEDLAGHKSRSGDGSAELLHQCEVVLDLPLDQSGNIRNVAFILKEM